MESNIDDAIAELGSLVASKKPFEVTVSIKGDQKIDQFGDGYTIDNNANDHDIEVTLPSGLTFNPATTKFGSTKPAYMKIRRDGKTIEHSGTVATGLHRWDFIFEYFKLTMTMLPASYTRANIKYTVTQKEKALEEMPNSEVELGFDGWSAPLKITFGPIVSVEK